MWRGVAAKWLLAMISWRNRGGLCRCWLLPLRSSRATQARASAPQGGRADRRRRRSRSHWPPGRPLRFGSVALLATIKPAAALSTTMSRAGPGSPERILRMMAALAAGPSTSERIQARAGDAEVFGLPGEFAEAVSRSPSPTSPRSGEGELPVTSVTCVVPASVTSPRPSSPETTSVRLVPSRAIAPAKQRPQLGPARAEQLVACAGRVHERAEDVEDRANAELLAHRGDVLHRRVHRAGRSKSRCPARRGRLRPAARWR